MVELPMRFTVTVDGEALSGVVSAENVSSLITVESRPRFIREPAEWVVTFASGEVEQVHRAEHTACLLTIGCRPENAKASEYYFGQRYSRVAVAPERYCEMLRTAFHLPRIVEKIHHMKYTILYIEICCLDKSEHTSTPTQRARQYTTLF